MDGPPPPPPPHGANPNTTQGNTGYRKATDLPDGKYDIFVVPPHSAGSGFIYLPSLQCHRNSFIAGSLSTLLAVVIWMTVLPTVKSWFQTTVATGGMGIIVLVIGVGAAGWLWGVSQAEGGPSGGPRGGRRPGGFGPGADYNTRGQNFGGHFAEGGSTTGGQYSGNQYNAGTPPPQSPPPPPPHSNNKGANKAESEWERAREETKRKEEIRRKMEAYKKKREAEELEKKRQREKEALEKQFREQKEKLEKEAAMAREAAERERLAKEKAEKEAAEKEAAAKEAARKEAAARFAAAREAAAKKYAAAKEAAAKEAAAKEAAKASPRSANSTPSAVPRTPSPKKPSARTAAEDDAYSFRPYDRPRRPWVDGASSVHSESSYAPSHAPSQSTSRTTPPPSNRGPYFTKDPDKVIIRGVYAFNNAFMKTPIAKLESGQGSVTDGLVLRITTEGLFIDDDVRGVAQREWDVKAWTMKLVEVCRSVPRTIRVLPPKILFKRSFFCWSVLHSAPSKLELNAFLECLLKIWIHLLLWPE